jgi:hypothetical protein
VCCALRIRCVDAASRGHGSQGKGKTADAETALVVAKEELKELEELRKLRRVWGERSKVPLKEQMAGSKQTKVAVVTSFGQPAQVHKEKFKALKERTDRQHRHDWLHHEATGVISALLYNAKGSAEQAAYILKKLIKEMFNGKLAHYMKAVDEVISDLDSRMTPELVAFNSVKEICASLTPLRSAEALEQRSILLTASVGAAHAVTLRGGSM